MARVIYRIDLAQLRQNFAVLQRAAGNCKLMPVLKYDAYGLGALAIGTALKQAGAVRFAAATLDEALILQQLGLPVQILGLLPANEIAETVRAGIIAPVANMATAQALSREACRQQTAVKIAVKLDTGMGRVGFQAVDSARTAQQIAEIVKLPGLEPDSLFAHFSTASQPDLFFAELQLRRYREVYDLLTAAGINFPYRHHGAGDAVMKLPGATAEPFNLARPGGTMYGEEFDTPCRQIVELRTFIGDIREIPAGGSINYFRTFIAPKAMKVAVLTAGYADGIPLALSNRGQVIINGCMCPILGRVTMDYVVVDISHLPDAAVGMEAILLGKRGEAKISVGDWGRLKNTHGHDIWCAIGHRAVREYAG